MHDSYCQIHQFLIRRIRSVRPISMECGNEISSSEDKFDFSLLKNEIMSICVTPDDREEESSDNDSNEVKSIKRRKIRIIENECESDSGSAV